MITTDREGRELELVQVHPAPFECWAACYIGPAWARGAWFQVWPQTFADAVLDMAEALLDVLEADATCTAVERELLDAMAEGVQAGQVEVEVLDHPRTDAALRAWLAEVRP